MSDEGVGTVPEDEEPQTVEELRVELRGSLDERDSLSEQLANLRERFEEQRESVRAARRAESEALERLDYEQRTVQFLVRQPSRHKLREEVQRSRGELSSWVARCARAETQIDDMQVRHAEIEIELKAQADELRERIALLEHDLEARVELGLAKEEMIAELRNRVDRAERSDSIAERANETLRTRVDTIEAAHQRYVDYVKRNAPATHRRALDAARKGS